MIPSTGKILSALFLVISACSLPQPRSYTLATPIAQSGPQHLLLGQAIDINTADAATLEALPGVGPALAQRIVAYRMAHGPFATVQDLDQVSGIGEKGLQRWSSMVQVSSKK